MEELSIYEQAIYKNNLPLYGFHKLKVKNERGLTVPLKCYPEQMYVYKVLQMLREQNIPVRIRVYKARKRGMSTFFVADMFHQFQFGDYIGWGEIYGHEKGASKNLYDTLKIYYDNLPDEEKRPWREYTQTRLVYTDGSQFNVKTVQGGGLSKSGTPNYLLLTEVGSYGDSAGYSLSEVKSSVPILPRTTIVEESTSRGHDSYWYPNHERWKEVVDSLSDKYGISSNWDEEKKGITRQYKLLANGQWPSDEYVHLFIPWWWSKRNRIEMTEEEKEEFAHTLTDYELAIIENLHLDYEQIRFRRQVKKQYCDNDENFTKEQYPCTVEESFVASGSPVFNAEKIDKEIIIVRGLKEANWKEVQNINLTKEYPKNKIVSYSYYYEKPPQEVKKGGVSLGFYRHIHDVKINPVAIEDTRGEWIEFNPPEVGWKDRYIIGADCALGLEKRDYDAAFVFDKLKRKFVAWCIGHYGVDLFPWELAKAGTRYNMADILVERNNSGIAVLTKLTEIYPNVLREHRITKGTSEIIPTAAYGVYTSGGNYGTKHIMISALKELLESIPPDSDGSIIPCARLLLEMKTFVKGPHGEMAAAGSHNNERVKSYDDAVMGAALTLYGAQLSAEFVPKKKEDKKVNRYTPKEGNWKTR